MTEHHHTPKYSKMQITKALVATSAGALLILVLFILPAEYGVDLTGMGRVTGLVNLGATKNADLGILTPFRSRVVPFDLTNESITIGPGEGLEFKFQLAKDDTFLYSWAATDPLYYDFHGEPKSDEGAAYLPFKSYEIRTDVKASGSLTTEFMGTHGWYWRNDSDTPVTVTLTAAGFYDVVGIIKAK
jgi:hypothetical protein